MERLTRAEGGYSISIAEGRGLRRGQLRGSKARRGPSSCFMVFSADVDLHCFFLLVELVVAGTPAACRQYHDYAVLEARLLPSRCVSATPKRRLLLGVALLGYATPPRISISRTRSRLDFHGPAIRDAGWPRVSPGAARLTRVMGEIDFHLDATRTLSRHTRKRTEAATSVP